MEHEYFSTTGPLSKRHGKDFRNRRQQHELVDIIIGLKSKRPAGVHGPVAIGKNDAIAVGALLSGIPTVVSTYSIALLDQLAEAARRWRQDFPDKRIVVMRGRTHYICATKLKAMQSAHDASLSLKMESRYLPVLKHAEQNELWAGGPDGVWELKQTSCPSRTRCSDSPGCHYYLTRDECADADLVVTTHAQVFANVDFPDMAGHWFTRQQWIADEGDQLIDAASDELEVSGWAMYAALHDPLTPLDICEAITRLVNNLHSIVGTKGSETFGQDQWQAYCDKWRDRFQECADKWPKDSWDADETRAHAAVRRIAKFLTLMSGDTIRAGFCVHRTSGKDKLLSHLPEAARRCASLKVSMKYLDLGDQLKRYAGHFDKFAAISGSMALPTATGMSFEFFERRSGIELVEKHILESPINYRENLRIHHAPISIKNQEQRCQVFAQLCCQVAQEVGPTLILCTSYASIEAVERAFVALDLPLLVQRRDSGESVAALARQVKEGYAASIVGNKSSWIGLDLDSRFKSTVILERAPMPSPSIDLVLDGLIRKIGEAAWQSYGAKQAMKLSVQGSGRTLRREVDRGTLILCDARFQGDYAPAIPPGQVVSLADALSWAKGVGTRCEVKVETASIPDDVSCDMTSFLEAL